MPRSDDNRINLVDDNRKLNELCSDLTSVDLIALDTEFVRTNTFYGRLGLIQLFDGRNCYLIDPIEITDWKSFCSLIQQPNRTTVFHSASEDLSLLQTSLKTSPNYLFDSQIAGAFLGLGFSLSYQALVKLVLGEHVEKDVTRSDWLARPLSARQLQYAAEDVFHLPALETCLREQMVSSNKIDWFAEECSNIVFTAKGLENQATWENAYSLVSNAWKLGIESLECLQQLCYWREIQARKRNKPKAWIAKDKDLFNIALIIGDAGSISTHMLKNEDKIDKRFIERDGDEILEMLRNSRYKLKTIDRKLLTYPLSLSARKILKVCQSRVVSVAEKLSMSPELLARKRILQKLVRDYECYGYLLWPEEFSEWRKEVLQDSFLSLFPSRG